MGRGSVTSLAPGFRFHPTDEELVRYYLKRKICNKPFRFDAISVVDIYKSEPWDLPDKSKLKSRDLEWYFFTILDKKYGNGSKTNRATEKGYWKTTGKDREIQHGSRIVGMKKTLVYHKGRAPHGERTNWVMHEYRIVDMELVKAGVTHDAYVLCRIFQKSGSGPKNGEQYGAPFVEEEWEDDEMTFVPDQGAAMEESLAVSNDDYVTVAGIDQKPENLEIYDAIPLPSIFYNGESSNNVESGNHSDSGNFIQPGSYVDSVYSEEDQKPIICDGNSIQPGSIFPDEPIEYSGVQEENAANFQSSDVFAIGNSYDDDNSLIQEPFINDLNNNVLLSDDNLFLETNDLSATYEDSFNFEDYLTFDADDENTQHLTFDASQSKPVSEGTEKEATTSKHVVEDKDKSEASCSNQDPDAAQFESESKYPFMEKAGKMMGGISAPAAIASEFPRKDMEVRLHSQASGSVHVTAGMIRIANTMNWSYSSYGKNGVLSFGLDAGSLGKTEASGSLSRAMVLFVVFWVLLLSISFKVGTSVSAR